eukprot:scaffold704_cov347-Prasinococcus_capsulatus_cf.AAC.26
MQCACATAAPTASRAAYLQLHLGGGVEVGVEAHKCELRGELRGHVGQRRLHLALHEVQLVARVGGVQQVVLHDGLGPVVPLVLLHQAGRVLAAGRLPRVHLLHHLVRASVVVLVRLGHALPRVPKDMRASSRECRRLHAPSPTECKCGSLLLEPMLTAVLGGDEGSMALAIATPIPTKLCADVDAAVREQRLQLTDAHRCLSVWGMADLEGVEEPEVAVRAVLELGEDHGHRGPALPYAAPAAPRSNSSCLSICRPRRGV